MDLSKVDTAELLKEIQSRPGVAAAVVQANDVRSLIIKDELGSTMTSEQVDEACTRFIELAGGECRAEMEDRGQLFLDCFLERRRDDIMAIAAAPSM